MIIDNDVAIELADGASLSANVYRPAAAGRYPVLMCKGIYGKDVHFADAYPLPWKVLMTEHPEVATEQTTGAWLRWEMPDPERWVPHGYVVINIDARGSGKSPGYLDPFSATATADYYDAIEWAGVQSWSNGKVGLLGISYLAITQWQVAALRPPHLAAICPWEGGSDIYRDWSHHGGILSNQFPTEWLPRQVLPNQHGNPTTTHIDRQTGCRTTGDSALSPGLLHGNRADHIVDLHRHPLDDAWYAQRSPRLERIQVPVLSAGNWGGLGLHLRGNIEAYKRAASTDKWLFIHAGRHFDSFYLTPYIEVQRRFFDHYLKGADNGWERTPRVQLEVRHPHGPHGPHGRSERQAQQWPLADTVWIRYFLNCEALCLTTAMPAGAASVSYDALGAGVDFNMPAPAHDIEFTGPLACRLYMASATADMDIFVTLRLFQPDGTEVILMGASEDVPVTRGWLRASHRKLDPQRSLPHQPFLQHDESMPLVPDEIYALDIEIWPTSIIVPGGYRLTMTIQGHDFEFPSKPGRMLHNSSLDRPAGIFAARNTIFSGPTHASYLLMPVVPAVVHARQ